MIALKALINQQREASFRPEFRANASDAEVLGILLAHYFKWDASSILEAAAAALEDANYHDTAARLQGMLQEAGTP